MSKKTPLYDLHLKANGKMVSFAGFSLPINYGSQLEEHLSVRNDAGMFDVSHMVVIDFQGDDTKEFLQYLLANDVAKLTKAGKALYSCMLNEKGGVIDDLIVYWLGNDDYRIISNAATRATNLTWMRKQISNFNATLTEKTNYAMLAVQGKTARDKVLQVLPKELDTHNLKRFFAAKHNDWFVGRSGYTVEDGFEIVSSPENIQSLWLELLKLGVKPCGLGARDTLRLEAGMALYGNDLDSEHSPFESGVAWSVMLQDSRDFIGKAKLTKPMSKMVGITLQGKGVIRSCQQVLAKNKTIVKVTSGGYSPSLGKSIGFARIDSDFLENARYKSALS